MEKKISQLTAKGANLASTDLLEISEVITDGYASKYVTGAEVIASAQTGMQTELISGTNIKTVNSTSLLGSGDVIVQPTLVSGTNIKTINGNSLLGSGDLVIGGGGLTIGTTAITSGTIGRILFEGTGNVLQESANLFWDNTNGRLGIGTASPNMSLDVRTGNVGIGVTSDAGYKLDVNGTARVKGVGATSATIAFTVQSSNGNNSLKVRDDNKVAFGNSSVDCTITGTAGSGNKFEFYAFNGYDVIDGFGNVLVTGLGNTIRLPRDVGIGFNTQNNASARLQVDSTTKGFLPPRMTTTQRNAIATPAAGLIVYDTTDNKHYGYNGTAWTAFY